MDNVIEARKFANIFEKKVGIFTFSCEMAIEIALKSINVKGRKVVLPSNICHRVLLSVIRSGGIPVLIYPENEFIISSSDISKVLKKYNDICTIILVHQFGIKCNIKEIRDIVGDIPIIEDFSQGWKIKDIGKYSNYIVTSFASSKQLSFGFGGIICTNDENINNLIDVNWKKTRNSEIDVLPYNLPASVNIKTKDLINKGNKTTDIQIKNAKEFYNLAKKINMNCLEINEGVWCRFPIWTYEKNTYEKALKMLKNRDYELPHKNGLEKVKFINGKEFFYENYCNKKSYIIL